MRTPNFVLAELPRIRFSKLLRSPGAAKFTARALCKACQHHCRTLPRSASANFASANFADVPQQATLPRSQVRSRSQSKSGSQVRSAERRTRPSNHETSEFTLQRAHTNLARDQRTRFCTTPVTIAEQNRSVWCPSIHPCPRIHCKAGTGRAPLHRKGPAHRHSARRASLVPRFTSGVP
jgi:hypothetical protein